MSDIDQLKMISLHEKVKQELIQFLNIDNDTLTEYVINQCIKCQDEDEFFVLMNQKDESFIYELAVNIHFLVKTFFPQNDFFNEPQEKIIKDDEIFENEENSINKEELAEKFPGLALQDTQIQKNQNSQKIEDQTRRPAQFENNFKTLKIGRIYSGKIVKVFDYGLLVEIQLKKKRKVGLVHISKISKEKIHNIRNQFEQGKYVFCELIEKTDKGKYSLSMKNINQYLGEYQKKSKKKFSAKQNEELQTQFLNFIKNQEFGPLTGIKLDLNNETGKTYEMDQANLWEQKQMEYMLGKNAQIFPNNKIENESIDLNEEEIQIEIKEEEPQFLKGQKQQSSADNYQVSLFRKKNGQLYSQIMKTQEETKKRRLEKIQIQNENISNEILLKSKVKIISQNKLKPKKFSNKEFLTQKQNLPIFKYKKDLIESFENNQILIVIGETGSGKTTQMPQYFLEYLQQKSQTSIKKIGCTQPRRIAARSVATRVAQEMGVSLGQQVGYSIRFEDRTSSQTLIKYMTDGILLRECLLDKTLSQYQIIIIDEVHERKIQTDILMCLLKQICKKRPDFKLIITSATLNSNKFAQYFENCPIFKIPGRAFPVKIFFTQKPEIEYLEASIQCALNIHLAEPKGDILLFLTGQEEIETACSMLQQKVKKIENDVGPLIIYPVYAALPQEKQQQIFEPTPEGSRKIVIATNIAEASLTIDGIFYVIDPGFAKVKFYNSKLGLEQLMVVPVSQASADQRAGRAGRTGPGKCYRLYTEKCYQEEMLPNSIAEIQRLNLAHVVLILKALGINDLINFDFIDKPQIKALISALENLYNLGALDENGFITKLGIRMSEFPLDPQLSKVLLASVDLMCSQEIVTIIGMLSVQGVFFRPKNLQQQADQQLKKFFDSDGDHLMLLKVFQGWMKNEKSEIWCHDNFIKPKSMFKALDIRNQLYEMLTKQELPVFSCEDDHFRIRKAILAGFFKNVARKEQGCFKTLVDEQTVFLHPSSCLFNKRVDYIVYNELIMTSKEYMRQVSKVDPKWLVQVAPNFYQIQDPEKMDGKKINFKIKPLQYNKNKPNNDWKMNRRIKDLNQLLNQNFRLVNSFLFATIFSLFQLGLKSQDLLNLLYAINFYYQKVERDYCQFLLK